MVDLHPSHTTSLEIVPVARVGQLPIRGRAGGAGMVDAVTVQPTQDAPQFTAVVTDITDRPRVGWPARVRLVWIGQRRVRGIEPGVRLRFEGMVRPVGGVPTIYNPRYEIIVSTPEGHRDRT